MRVDGMGCRWRVVSLKEELSLETSDEYRGATMKSCG